MNSPAFLRLLCLALPGFVLSCAPPAYKARGQASYIADHYAGHYTTSGQLYHPMGYTAAHNNLPFGTEVKVKNNYNGRTVKVVVNDRFPYYPNRVINLSRAAAQQLQIPYQQMADVTVTAKSLPGQQAQRGSRQNAPTPQQPPQGYGQAAPAGYGNYGAAPANYGTAPANYGAPRAGYGTAPANYGTPPAGYGTTAMPSGLGPAPAGYR